jgi:hypothetical protein
LLEVSVPKPLPADWSAALLTSSSETLLGAVRNYIGAVKTPYDKRDLVAKLVAFLNRKETRDSLFSLLDPLDCKILGSALLVGPVPEQALKELFIGEIPLFELGVRISNLLDRLLLFRYPVGGRKLVAVNPLLEEELGRIVLEPGAFYGLGPREEAAELPATDAKAAVALFTFLLHAPGSMKKGGGLTKRAAERLASLLADSGLPGEERLGALALALAAAGALPPGEEEGRSPDRAAFARLLAEWGEDLPYYLASCLSEEKGAEEGLSASGAELSGRAEAYRVEGSASGGAFGGGGAAWAYATVLAGALEAMPDGALVPRSSLARWLRIVARRARLSVYPSEAIPALESLGIVAPRAEGLVLCLPSRGAAGRGGEAPAKGSASRGPILVVEGAHALHLMPEATLEERLFVGSVARPSGFGLVWNFEVERETVRRAFAAGLSAAEIKSRFAAMSGNELPQSFAFSLGAWEEEYRSLRLYRGFVLVADERQRPVIERSAALGRIVAERLAPGVYLLSAATAEAAAAALEAAGLEAPPLVAVGASGSASGAGTAGGAGSTGATGSAIEGATGLGRRGEATTGSRARLRIDELRDLVGLGPSQGVSAASPRDADPEPRLAELRSALAQAPRSDEERRELADRIERRLVLTERQIAQADPHPERLEASGLDYLGKVRVVERALRTSGDRLEVLYRLPGEEPVRALLRPVRLDKNDKGLVLEAEDLGSGSPARVPLGAVSTVRRLRASLFGEDQ